MLRKPRVRSGIGMVLLAAACSPNLPIIPSEVTMPVSQQLPAPTSAATAPPVAVTQDLTITAVFPAGTLIALRAGLTTQGLISPQDLPYDAYGNFAITIDGSVVPKESITLESPPTMNSQGEFVFQFRLSNQTLSPYSGLTVKTPDEKLILKSRLKIPRGNSTKSFSVSVDVTTTAETLLREAAIAAGMPPDTTIPVLATERMRDLLVSAMLSKTPGNPTASPKMTYALATMVKAIRDGKSLLANQLSLDPPSGGSSGGGSSGGGGGGGGGGGPTCPAGDPVVQAATIVGTTPKVLAVDANDNAWVANSISGNVSKIAPDGTVSGTYAVGSNPSDIAIDSNGNAWVMNTGSTNVHKIAPDGTISGPYAVGTWPRDIAIDTSGNAWVVSSISNDVHKIAPDGTVSGPYAVGGDPRAIAVDTSGNAWVANITNNTVSKFAPDGTVSGPYAVGAQPLAITIDTSGNAWVANRSGDNVHKIAPDGTVSGPYAVGSSPSKIAIDSNDNAWVINQNSNDVHKIAPDGTVSGPYAVGAYPEALAIDSNDNVWVANYDSDDVHKIAPDGTVFGPYAVGDGPISIGFTTCKSNVWVANDLDDTVVRITQ